MERASHFLYQESLGAITRIGDHQRRGKDISVSLVFSQLTRVPRLGCMFVPAECVSKKQQCLLHINITCERFHDNSLCVDSPKSQSALTLLASLVSPYLKFNGPRVLKRT